LWLDVHKRNGDAFDRSNKSTEFTLGRVSKREGGGGGGRTVRRREEGGGRREEEGRRREEGGGRREEGRGGRRRETLQGRNGDAFDRSNKSTEFTLGRVSKREE
jgi:hypothetical protein